MRSSVVMCTYNGARYLQAQLDSIARQSTRPDELVVCDDHSTDDTPEIVRRFGSTAAFPVRVHVNEKNLGIHQNFGRAMSLANADVIFLSDQDDVWEPGKIETFLEVFQRSAPGVQAR